MFALPREWYKKRGRARPRPATRREHQATKARSFNVPVGELFDAWANVATRKKWMGGVAVRVRTATKPKSMRLDRSDGSIIAVGFLPKGKAKSSVAIEHTKLASREAAARVKEEWSARFDALKEVLVHA